MIWLHADAYVALLSGSSNFTRAGLRIGPRRNAEANLLTRVDRVAYGREAGELEGVWPETEPVDDPESAEWLGARPERDEEEQAAGSGVPSGFLAATYLAGDARRIVLHLDPQHLPASWTVEACGHASRELLTSAESLASGGPLPTEILWEPVEPPDMLLVRWGDREGFLVLNVDDARALPPPTRLEQMSADDMLAILAAADPGAAVRAWIAAQRDERTDTDDLDQAIDLDPLRRYGLGETFLHRIRDRARLFAQVRAALERPAWGRSFVDSRLRGFIGVKPLAERMATRLSEGKGRADEQLLALCDLLIVLCEVQYTGQEGMLSTGEFEAIFRPFLTELADELDARVVAVHGSMSTDALGFWKDVVERCRA